MGNPKVPSLGFFMDFSWRSTDPISMVPIVPMAVISRWTSCPTDCPRRNFQGITSVHGALITVHPSVFWVAKNPPIYCVLVSELVLSLRNTLDFFCIKITHLEQQKTDRFMNIRWTDNRLLFSHVDKMMWKNPYVGVPQVVLSTKRLLGHPWHPSYGNALGFHFWDH